MKFNEEETTEGGQESGYFIATMKNLTIDGWVVVVICVFMFFIALYVMFSKGRFIARQSRSNEGFSEAFDQLAAALLKEAPEIQGHIRRLDHLSSRESDFGDSSLHRIYQVGTKELVGRFNAVQGSQEAMPKISANAMAAVRASLDAQLTRERQRLDRGMVLLTIAISGGPFLGLLGTVVGVMITFAAIAAAGDVNVNAIAPGIAAALVATVAGLGVAIPALFGYNYLQTRVKEIAVDMNVFVDEFVTKMAENYGS
jgi:biopolymer transport protein ExbB